jgi:hypothetical protein
MSEILTEIEDSNELEKTSMNAINGGQANFERKAEFLNKEISFLLDNLRRVSILLILKLFYRKRLITG